MNATDLDAELLAVLEWLWAVPPLTDPAVEARSRELLLDTIGCAIAGSAAPEVGSLWARAASIDEGAIRFPGACYGLSASAFARLFATAACWHEACEGLASAHGRPGLHAIPAVLGLALARSSALGAVLGAIATGYEVGGRLGAVCRIRSGMHVDGTWGSFAAAAAASRWLGASPGQALAALNHAACHMPFSLYWPIAAGSSARNAYAGHGSAHGMQAALAALAGLGAPPGGLTEMLRLALDRRPQPLAPVGKMLLLDGYLKPYPAVRHVHYGVLAAEAWSAGRADDIRAVRLAIYPEAITYCGNRAPRTAIQAQFSLSYGVARTLAYGRFDPAAYTEAALADPLVRRLEALVELRPDAVRGGRGCTLDVDGWRCSIDRVPGDPGLPMTRDAVRAKFLAYAGPVIGQAHADAIAGRLLDGALDAPLDLAA